MKVVESLVEIAPLVALPVIAVHPLAEQRRRKREGDALDINQRDFREEGGEIEWVYLRSVRQEGCRHARCANV